MSTPPELFRALGFLCEAPGPGQRQVAEVLGIDAELQREDHTELFVLQFPPYQALYLGPEGMLGGEGADQVAGFWRAIGSTPPPEADHLAALLGLYALLSEADSSTASPGAGAVAGRARQVLLVEHLLSWVPVFADALSGAAADIGAEGYAQWAALLGEALAAEAARLGVPASLPRALRVAPGMPAVEEERDALVGAVLAPVRSGMLVSRRDLLRAGRRLGAPGRAGERRFALTSMLDTAPVEVLSWLSIEAASWERRHLAREPLYGEVSLWWAGRAASAAAQLGDMAESLTRFSSAGWTGAGTSAAGVGAGT